MTTAAPVVNDLCTIEQERSHFNDQFGEMSERARVKVKGEMSSSCRNSYRHRRSW